MRKQSRRPLQVRREVDDFAGIHGEFLAEMVRQAVFEQYPEDVYTKGFRVYTTIRKADQEAAYEAVRRGLLSYDHSQGYRGPEAFVELAAGASEDDIEEALAEYPDVDDLKAAMVLEASAKEVKAVLKSGETVAVSGEGLRFAARALDDKTARQRRIRRGAVIRLQADDKKNWQVTQLPEAEAAFVSLDPGNGAIRALVGGFDFHRNKFNHITQAWRQPGSAFKPFIYSASLEKGFTPATIIPDEPIVVEAEVTGSQRWEPKNYDGKFEGPMRLRTALAKSKNMVSIRILQAIDPKYAQDYVTRFGFDADKHPPYLTMALGAGSVTPLQMARGYAVFANGGYMIQPHFIQKIVDDRGNELGSRAPAACGRRSAARDRRAQCIHHGFDDAGRDALRHRGEREQAGAARSRRQDRHHQRLRRRLVLRLPARARRRRLDGIRSAQDAGQEPDRGPDRAADLDRLHEPGAERRSRVTAQRSRRGGQRAHRCRSGGARRRAQAERNFFIASLRR